MYSLKYIKEFYLYTNSEGMKTVSIIKSSFVGFYNVIQEDAEFDSSTFIPTLTPDQIKNKFEIDIEEDINED